MGKKTPSSLSNFGREIFWTISCLLLSADGVEKKRAQNQLTLPRNFFNRFLALKMGLFVCKESISVEDLFDGRCARWYLSKEKGQKSPFLCRFVCCKTDVTHFFLSRPENCYFLSFRFVRHLFSPVCIVRFDTSFVRAHKHNIFYMALLLRNTEIRIHLFALENGNSFCALALALSLFFALVRLCSLL